MMGKKRLQLQRVLGVCVIIVLVMALSRSFQVDPLPHKMQPSTIHVEQIEWDDCTQLSEDSWDYTYHLPNLILADDIICVATSWTSADVYVDTKRLTQFDDTAQEKGPGIQWIRMPLWAAGKTLHVVYSGDQSQVEISAGEKAYYGNAALVYLTFLADKVYALVFAGSICLLLLLLIYCYRLMSPHVDRGMRRGICFLGMFLLTTGIWVVCDSKIMFTLSRNVAANTILNYASLALFPMFLIMFVSEMTDHRIKILDVLPLLYMLDLLYMMTSLLTHLISLVHTLFIVHALIVVSIIAIILGVFLDVKKNKNKEMKMLLVGFCGLALAAVVALVRFRRSTPGGYAPVFCVGLYIFIFFIIWAAYDRMYRIMGHNANVMAYRRLAYKDVLTDLGNRAAFMKEEQDLSPEESVGFIVMDINNLKHTNDCYGHQAGDELICSAADCISKVFQDKGNAYRIGGDEFVVIVKDATEEYLEQLLRRLEEAQEEKQKELGKPWKLQIAYGYAVHSKENSYEELFRQADDRMYECKRRMKEIEQRAVSENLGRV